jgi:MarR family transcriptional regulator, 2-MHQ and catechol-resistance regulon repressor
MLNYLEVAPTVTTSSNPDSRLALASYVKLMRAADSVTARVHRHLQQAGLSVTQFGVLEALFHVGPLCQRDLGRKLLKSSGNMTLVVDNLEKRGLVERHREMADRRFLAVVLTAAGRRLMAEIFPRHVAGVAAEFAILTVAEQQELARLCRKLGRREDVAGGIPARETGP